ncbi:hypothetical protein SAMN05421505_1687 [Sinosporangium album]|uniref:Uncharacterized protein n=1 Tax=Sinosporangium album TaxID=504805 RepID=A0A1G8LHM0_9ACTN|nr:hypothetical protein [Sinosporangium album]SDI55118.1 hypothetical protein SAMN05421505_1687 [Sinosporangium album]
MDNPATEQWLHGYLLGSGGMAQDERLLEHAAEAGHATNALHRAARRAGIQTGELSRGTKWSRWWWLPGVTYTQADAKLVGITSEWDWPYGPNIDLRSRVAMIEWAKGHGLRLARSSAPLCPTWLEQGRCRGCDKRGGHHHFRLDHMSGWTRGGAPAVIVNHPYGLGADDVRYLDEATESGLLTVSVPGAGWYGHSTIQVELWATAAYDAATKARLTDR